MTDRFVRRLREGSFAVTLEITPPQKPLPELLRRRARMLGDVADAVNVIQRPGRSTSLAASIELSSDGFEPVWHVASRGRARSDLSGEIEMAARAGIRCALCIRGDHAARDREDTPKLRELVGMLRDGLPNAVIGATANQYGPRDAVLRNLLPKLRAGAAFVQTQPLFDWETFASLSEAIKQRSPETWVIPMLMPLLSAEAARGVSERLGIEIPASMVERLQQGGEAAGWAIFRDQLERLFDAPLADGIAVMTREMDPPSEVTRRIAHSIEAVRPGSPSVAAP